MKKVIIFLTIILIICLFNLKKKNIIEKFPYYRPIHYNQIGGYVPNIVLPPSYYYNYSPFFYYNPYNALGSYCRRFPLSPSCINWIYS